MFVVQVIDDWPVEPAGNLRGARVKWTTRGPDGKQYFFDGKVRGKILESARGVTQPKMPYAPIFMPDGTDKVWGEMTVEEENQISHRGKAFKQARKFFENL